jgi:putative Holliday junction resolvase
MPRWKKSLAWSNTPFSGKIMSGSRILALDYGTKRIGVALSDELGWTAQPLETFERRTLDRDVAHIASLVHAHAVGEVVLGFPLQLDGREGPAIQAMRNFAVHLEQGLPVPLVLWDERLTTKAAEDLLIAADVSRKKRKGAVDRVAAAILLQSYLASREQAAAPAAEQHWSTVDSTDEASEHSPPSAGRGRRARRRRVSDH